jgi:hypothetical protein
MFVTKADFEHARPAALCQADTKHWHAMALSLHLPWFLVVTKVKVKRQFFTQTTALAWEWSVIGLVENTPPKTVLSLHYISPCPRPVDGWTMSRISELWRPSNEELVQTGPLLLRFADKEGLYDCYDAAVLDEHPDRRLLLRIGA